MIEAGQFMDGLCFAQEAVDLLKDNEHLDEGVGDRLLPQAIKSFTNLKQLYAEHNSV